ncbi:TraB/GumN family protein [Sphingomonas koreensis]
MKLAALALLIAASAAAPAHAQNPAIWSLSDEDTTIYLFGTVHALDEGQAWFVGDIAAAYRKADEVVFETVMTDDEAARQSAVKYGKADHRLRDLLPNPRAFEAALSRGGAKKDALDGYDPWFANVVVGTIALMDSRLKRELSVEAALRDAAKRDGKVQIALETLDEQFAVFDTIPVAAQLKQLEATLAEPARVKESAEQTVQCWKIGDLACIKEASDRDTGALPEVRDALLVQRNKRWAAWIADRMHRPGTSFVAVGVEHFVGGSSLPDELAARGLSPVRLGVSPTPKPPAPDTRKTAAAPVDHSPAAEPAPSRR